MTQWNGSQELRPRLHESDSFESATFSFWIQKFPRPHVSLFKSYSPVHRYPTGIRIHTCTQNSFGKIGNGACISLFLERTWERGCHLEYSIHGKELGPVVRRPISANPGLNFNPGFFFFCSKAFSWINFSILFIASTHQIVDKKNKTEFAF